VRRRQARQSIYHRRGGTWPVPAAGPRDSLTILRQTETRERAEIRRARAIRRMELLPLVSFRTGFGLNFAIDSPERRSRCRLNIVIRVIHKLLNCRNGSLGCFSIKAEGLHGKDRVVPIF